MQGKFGYLPAEVQEVIAHELNMPVAKVYGIVSFYSFFTMEPKGEHPIDICLGTACYVRGAEKVLDAFQRNLGIQVGKCTPDGKFSLNTLRCVGACGLAPVASRVQIIPQGLLIAKGAQSGALCLLNGYEG